MGLSRLRVEPTFYSEGAAMNRHYRVNGIEGVETRIELLGETDGGYDTRITSTSATGVWESYEFINEDLLDSCVRTGYLVATERPGVAFSRPA